MPQLPIAHKQLHQEQVSGQGQRPAAQMKVDQASPASRTVQTGPVGPCPFLVPQKVVEDGHPHGQTRSKQIVQAQPPGQDSQGGKLHQHAQEPH